MPSCRALRFLGQGFPLLAILPSLSVAATTKDVTKTMCGAYGDSSTVQYAGATSNSGKYLYGANQWGWDSSGAQCMSVDLDDSDDAGAFNVTWSWTERDVWVHSYPNIGLESVQLPSRLDNVKSFQVNAAWDMFPSADPDATNKTQALEAIGTKADIALDMFIDSNNVTSMNASAAAFEVMVWSAVWGGVAPIGYQTFNAESPKYNLSGVEYSLYSGFNQQGQKQAVFSWVPEGNQNGIQADLWELVTYLVNAGNLTSDMYLGLIQFGTETVHATQNVTFQMQKAQMDLSVIKEKPTTTKGSPPATASATSKGAAYQVAPTGFALPAAAMGIAAAVLL